MREKIQKLYHECHEDCHVLYFLFVAIEGHGWYAIMAAVLAFLSAGNRAVKLVYHT